MGELIKNEFGVEYSIRHVSRILIWNEILNLSKGEDLRMLKKS
ncbi:hypothetical protein DRN79_04130, partial [Methanosarcinales archaeon]